MNNRFNDALSTIEVCSIPKIARTLVKSCNEALRSPEFSLGSDPAIRLIISRLAYLAGIWNGVGEFDNAQSECRALCEERKI